MRKISISEKRINYYHKNTELITGFDTYKDLTELKEILAEELSERTNDIIESEIIEADSLKAIKEIAEKRGHKIILM